jgi:predicted CopG family antitoxin
MVDWRTIKVPEMDYVEAREAKRDNESWGDYVRRCANESTVTMNEEDIREIVREEIEAASTRY